jgi:hypothetical protein
VIDPKIIAFATNRIKLEIEEQDKRVTKNIETLKATMASRGMLNSGNMIAAVQDECAKAVYERADIVWQVLHRAITTAGVEYEKDLEQQLQTAATQYFPEHMNGLKYRVHEVAKLIGMGDLVNRIPDKVLEARSAALQRICSEIELFALALKKAPTDNAPYAPQINISHSSIGAFQAGHQAVAHVTQQIRNEDREGLIRALDMIERELGKVGDIPSHDKSEIIEMVNEGKGELAKEKPNLSKVKAYLPTISDALKVVGELKPAYETLKSAARVVGIDLP